MLPRLIVAVLSLQSSACLYGYNTHSRATLVGAARPPNLGTVEVYFTPPPKEDFVEVAYIEAVGREGADEGEMLSELKRRAAEFGADAIYVKSQSSESRRAGSGAQNVLRGVIIAVAFVAVVAVVVAAIAGGDLGDTTCDGPFKWSISDFPDIPDSTSHSYEAPLWTGVGLRYVPATLVSSSATAQRAPAAPPSLSLQTVEAMVDRHRGQVAGCAHGVDLEELRIRMRWQIEVDGSVTHVQRVDATREYPAVESCLREVIGQWQFPEGSKSWVIHYPFHVVAPVPQPKFHYKDTP